MPELDALRGVEQNRFHHLDVYGRALEVLDRTVELTERLGLPRRSYRRRSASTAEQVEGAARQSRSPTS